MKKTISALVCAIMLVGMLMSSASATATIYYPTKEHIFVPCQVMFALKKQDSKVPHDLLDFPELPALRYEPVLHGTLGLIEYNPDSRLTVEEAMKMLAENPMIESVEVNGRFFLDEPEMPPVPVCRGDVNCDRALNAKDVTLMMEYILGRAELSYNGLAAVDVNGDGWVNAKDITQVMRWILEG